MEGSGCTTLLFSDALNMCSVRAGSVQQPQEVCGSGTRGAHLRTEVCGHCHQVTYYSRYILVM
jgi:hypothetical protein